MEPQESAASSSGLSCNVKQLDDALRYALTFGWPLWCGDGDGKKVPGDVHDFSFMNLKFGARVDGFRGRPSDDIMNKDWEGLYNQLPQYRAYIEDHQDPTCTRSSGNAMEQACVVSYAAATSGRYFPAGSTLL